MAVLLALASSLMWGVSDFLGGNATRRLPSLIVFGVSQAFGLLTGVVIFVLAGAAADGFAYWPWSVLAGLTGLVALLAFYNALALGPMGIVSPIAALGVVVPLAWGLVFAGEQPSGAQVLGIVAAVIGILLASGPELSSAASLRPLLLAGGAAVGFGVVFLFMAEGSKVSAIGTMTGMRVTTVSLFVIYLLVRRPVGVIGRADLPMLAVIGVFDVGANIAYGVATTMGMLSITSVLASLYPVLTAMLAAVFLHERLKPVQYAGVVAAVVGIAFIAGG